MANTAAVYGRVDPKIKDEVDKILKTLGVSQSTLIQMVYNEIYLTRKIPVSLSIPNHSPLSIDNMSKEEFDYELQKGLNDLASGRVYSSDEVDEILRKEFNI